ncbi:uncharacterized protein LOC111674897 [Lucilia cuprina]|uniref:uncharacterized protein LOC111674897 n=1 Tax=Lucilia cuprina TaxID=7375 RepID=UPI001F05F627|nr:uncharacterized protein LOC111674897 [Lucilia cuprina]
MLFKEITLVTFLAILAVSTANQAAENGTSILCGTLRVIFVNILKPKCMSVSVIVNISDHEDFKFSKDILDDVMTINKNIQVPVAINQYTASKLLHLIQAKLIFTNSAENISKHCDCTEPILLKRFDSIPNKLYDHDLFPIKTKNFYQCSMKVVLWHIPPFMNLTYENNMINYKGFDADILKDLAEILNFSINVIPNEPQNFISGNVFPNRTAIGVFKLLLERKANLTIGFIGCLPRRLQLTTGSKPYFLSKVLIILKNSPKFTPYHLLLRPFNITTWGFLLTLVVLKSILKRLFCRNIKLRHSFRKLLQLQWLLLMFIIRLSYEGSIFQAIRMSPYQRLPLSIDEVVKQNYSLVTDYAAARILSEMSYLKNITTIVPGNPQSVLESIDDLPPKTGVLSSDIFIALFMKRRLSNYSEYAIVRDKVSNTMNCIFFPRLSFIAPAYLPLTTDQLRYHYNWNLHSPLDLNILKAVFICFTIMSVISVLVFLLELLSLRYINLRRIFTIICGY